MRVIGCNTQKRSRHSSFISNAKLQLKTIKKFAKLRSQSLENKVLLGECPVHSSIQLKDFVPYPFRILIEITTKKNQPTQCALLLGPPPQGGVGPPRASVEDFPFAIAPGSFGITHFQCIQLRSSPGERLMTFLFAKPQARPVRGRAECRLIFVQLQISPELGGGISTSSTCLDRVGNIVLLQMCVCVGVFFFYFYTLPPEGNH